MRASGVGLAIAIALTCSRARSQSFSLLPTFAERLPGSAREIPRWTSASRDTPVLEGAYGPRAQSSLGFELCTVRLHWEELSLRLGVNFMVALENVDSQGASSFPFVASQLFRGLYGSSLAFSADRLAHRWLGPRGAIEIAILYGHETAHAAADFIASHPDFHDASARGDIPDGGSGDFFQADYAIRAPIAGDAAEIVARVQDRLYVHGPILHAPGADLIARAFLFHGALIPQIAAYGERTLTDRNQNGARPGGFVRVMLGVAAPGKLGVVMPFVSADGGNGKGLLINRREAHASFGIRYTPF